ncbi:hypothetical protein [Citricoccus sp.]|uniref:hypothetical protein n=1 Tax=Citricoccus sp. TaxID=1978372 RepID=UPI0028BE8273|nr:hypothetical protein [Citricoccus sp.]
MKEHHGEGGDQAEPVEQGQAGPWPICRLLIYRLTTLLTTRLTTRLTNPLTGLLNCLLNCLLILLLIYLDPRQLRRRDHGPAPSLRFRAAPRSASRPRASGSTCIPSLMISLPYVAQLGGRWESDESGRKTTAKAELKQNGPILSAGAGRMGPD